MPVLKPAACGSSSSGAACERLSPSLFVALLVFAAHSHAAAAAAADVDAEAVFTNTLLPKAAAGER